MYKVTLYRAEGTVENPSILEESGTGAGPFEEKRYAEIAFGQIVRMSVRNGADIEVKNGDGDAYWITDSGRIGYCLKIEEV